MTLGSASFSEGRFAYLARNGILVDTNILSSRISMACPHGTRVGLHAGPPPSARPDHLGPPYVDGPREECR